MTTGSESIIKKHKNALANKTVLADVLGLGRFYYELSVQVLTICFASREENGGLIALDQVQRSLSKIRGAEIARYEDHCLFWDLS